MLHVQFVDWSSRNEFNSINFILIALQKFDRARNESIYASRGEPKKGQCPPSEAARRNSILSGFRVPPAFSVHANLSKGASVAAVMRDAQFRTVLAAGWSLLNIMQTSVNSRGGSSCGTRKTIPDKTTVVCPSHIP